MTVFKDCGFCPTFTSLFLAAFTLLTCRTVASSALPTTVAELNEWYSQPTNGQNAAELVIRGASFLNTSSKRWSSSLPWLGDASPPELDKPVPASMDNAMAMFLRENQNAFHYFREAADLEQSRYPIDFFKEPNPPLPHLSKAKLASRYLAICTLHAASHNQLSKAAEALLASFGVAGSLAQEPCLISQLVRISMITQTREAMEQALNRVTLPSDSFYKLDALLQKLEPHDANGIGLFRGLVGDRVWTVAFFDLPADQGDVIITNLLRQFDDADRVKFRMEDYSKVADKEFVDNFYARILELATNAYPERLRVISKFSSELVAVAKEKHCLIGYHQASGMAGAFSAEARSIVSLRMARIAIALERRRAITGNYPETLRELRLVAANLNTLDPFGGEQLEYKRSSTGYALTTTKFETPKGPKQISFQIMAAPPGKPVGK